jgi:hypothetical protein
VENQDQDQDQGTPQPARPTAGGGPRLPRRLRWITLPDEYGTAGFRIQMWVNCPSRLYDEALMRSAAEHQPDNADLEQRVRALQSREQAGEDVEADEYLEVDRETDGRQRRFRTVLVEAERRRDEALSQIFVEHNGWCDPDGTPYPPAADPAFWGEIPDELASALLILLQTEKAKLPTSLARARAR